MEGGFENRRDWFRKRVTPGGEEITSPSDAQLIEPAEQVDPAPTGDKVPNEFFVVMPGEIPEAHVGGRYVIDDSIDLAATPGAFEKGGRKFRKLSDAERPHFNIANARRLDTVNAPATPDAAAAGTTAGVDTSAAPTAAAGDASGRPADATHIGAAAGPTDTTPAGTDPRAADAAAAVRRELEAREHAVRTNLRGLTRRVTRAAGDRPERVFYTHTEWPGREFKQDEVDRMHRGESILPPEPPAGGAGGGGAGGEPPAGGEVADGAEPSPEGEPDAPPPPPDWWGRYFEGVPGKSWEKFNIKDYADITPKSFNEIFNNQMYAQGFGQFITALDPEKLEIWTRVLASRETESLSAEDNRFLHFAQLEFTKNTLEYEKIATTFNKNTIESLVAVNEDFRELVDKFGIDNAAKVYKESIFFVGMRNKGEFDKTVNGFKVWNDGKAMERAKKAEEHVQRICNEAGIQRRNFESFFGIGEKGRDANDPAVRERLIAHMQKQAKTFLSAREWIALNYKGGYSGKAQRLIGEAHRAMPQHWLLLNPTSRQTSAMLGARKDIASVMADTISTPEMRNRMDRAALLGEAFAPPRKEAGPKTLADVRALTSKDELKEDGVERYLRRRIETIPDFDSKPPSEKDRILGDMKYEMAREHVGGTETHPGGNGFLAWLFRLLFARTFDKVARKVAAGPERRS